MRTTLTAVFVAALGITGAAQQGAATAADATAIRALAQQLDDARNTQNWKAISAPFTSDADQLTSTGEWRRGHAEIEKGITTSMTTTYKGARFVTKIESVRMIGPNAAIADGPFSILNVPGGGTRRGHTTYVVVKSGGQWKIAAARSMVNAAIGATAK